MKISGKDLSQSIHQDIIKKVEVLKKQNILPYLVIVKSSDIPAVNAYIKQKIKRGEKLGIKVEVKEWSSELLNDPQKIESIVKDLNNQPKIHGIIFQKPSHPHINNEIEQLVDPIKDVDGFLPRSFHKNPVYRGILKVFENVYLTLSSHPELVSGSVLPKTQNYNSKVKTEIGSRNPPSRKASEGHSEFGMTLMKELWPLLSHQRITVIGKGKTGGGAVIHGLMTDGFPKEQLQIIDTKTTPAAKKTYIQHSDIIISTVGKPNIIDVNLLPHDVILIDVGVHFDEQNKIHGDFDEEEIKDRVAFYTTTPGGIGTLTVAYLMDNVVNAALQLNKVSLSSV